MADEIKFKSAEDFSITIKLYSGREVFIDLMKITDREWRAIFKADTSEKEEVKLICKVTDLEPKEYLGLKVPELKQLTETLLKLGLQPAANPT